MRVAINDPPAAKVTRLFPKADGLATMSPENVRAGGKMIEVTRVRITDAGRRAIEQ
jgi:hypothetical protein